MSEARIGKPHTEETRRKIGAAHKGRIISEETRKKMSEAHKKPKKMGTP
ncbi:MAG: NUMOD3 domain-containing DNA-binding protein [Methanoregula sp.]|nr:NUMOD3 domain-containing DNA-binding protein [Methanoregula sp.]MDP2796584.1 NUMOD3 domain-containing DNA-binding protein [Methanoregula sp.]